MIYLLALSVVLPTLAGFFLVSLFWPKARASARHSVLKASLAVGFGLGLSSVVFFLWLLAGRASAAWLFVAEIAVLAGLAVVVLYRSRKKEDSPACHDLHTDSSEPRPIARILAAVFAIALCSAVIALAFVSLARPHGVKDSWSIWNLRARFLFRSGDHWQESFSPLVMWSSPDYPLLVPGTIARCWTYIGEETQVAPATVSIVFFAATITLIVSALSVLRSRGQGFLAGLILLGSVHFVDSGGHQLADIPVGFFVLAAFVLLCMQDRLPQHAKRLLFLTGMAVALAAWTKNEGLLFLVAITAARVVAIWLTKSGWGRLRQIVPYAAGLAPVLVVVAYYKAYIAPTCTLIAPQTLQTVADRITNPARYLEIAVTFARKAFDLAHWTVLLLTCYGLAAGAGKPKEERLGITTAAIAILFMLAGYFAVYVLTPYDLTLHLRWSFRRLLLHLWPGIIFICFLLLRTPEEALVGRFQPREAQ